MSEDRPWSEIQAYFTQLFTSDAFPNPQLAIQEAQKESMDSILVQAMRTRRQVTSRGSSSVSSSNLSSSNPVIKPRKHDSEVQVSCPAIQDTPQQIPAGTATPHGLSLDTSKLPPLPNLPAHLRELPYIRCRQKSPAVGASLECLGAHIFHQRQELVGDAVLGMLIKEWLINNHPFLRAEVAAPFWEVLVSNSLFARLARAYGMAQKLAAISRDEAARLTEEDKVLANAFEAYFDNLMNKVASDNMAWNVLKRYVDSLFSSGAFPDLEARLRMANEKLSRKSTPMQLPSKSPGLHIDKEARKPVEQPDRQPQPTVQGEPESLPSKEPSRKRAKRAAKKKQANPPHEYVDKPPGT